MNYRNLNTGFPSVSVVRNPPANGGDWRFRFNPWVGKIPWRRKWQPMPVLLPEKSHGQRTMADYRPTGCEELDMTERLSTSPGKKSVVYSHLPRQPRPQAATEEG